MNRSTLAAFTLLSTAEKSLPSSAKDSSTLMLYLPPLALTNSVTPLRKSLPCEVFSHTSAILDGLGSLPASCSFWIQRISVALRFSTEARVPKIHLKPLLSIELDAPPPFTYGIWYC